jgi:uncharacterized protein YodC (DUF2158 family)
MNFKRSKPKNARAGCLMCKWFKQNGLGEKKRPVNERKSDPKANREKY